jgi:hypothetical protein
MVFSMAELDSTDLYIGDTPQYFFDNGMIEEIQNVSRTIHRPEMCDENPLIEQDRPWEHALNMHADDYQVWRDDAGVFHCLYSDFNINHEKLAREGGTAIDWDISRFCVCYARSEDGLTWTKPPLGIREVGGHDTNIILGDETFGNVWGVAMLDDPLEADPARRYKAIHEIGPPGFRVADELPGANVRRAHSPDGIHWTHYDDPPVFQNLGAKQGDSIYPFFDPATQTYLILTRHPLMELAPRSRPSLVEAPQGGGATTDPAFGLPNRRGMRRIFLSESRDFHHWSEPRMILAPDPELDNLDDSFYSMRPYRLGSHWIGFLGVLSMVDYTLFPQLAYSRDARNWSRLAPTHPWMGSGGEDSFNEFITAVPHLVDVGDETWLFFGGVGAERKEGDRIGLKHRSGYALGLGKMRRNGFVSIGAGEKLEGMLMTQPVIAPGDQLIVNAACGPNGYIKVEVMDVQYRALDGRSVEDCDVFTGDDIAHAFSWGGETTIPLPAGTDSGTVYTTFIPHRRLRFVLRNAEIYSFQIKS